MTTSQTRAPVLIFAAWFAACVPANGHDRGPTGPDRSTAPAPTCVSPLEVDQREYAAWGAARGYLELVKSCVGPRATTAWFLLSRDPRVLVVAVCNGKTGGRRCIYNRTIRDE